MKSSANTKGRNGYQAILLAALVSGLMGTANAAQNVYLMLEGDTQISSESSSDEWEGWIHGRAFGKGYHCLPADRAQPVPQLARTFDVIRYVDKASPLLSQAALEGQVFPRVTAVYQRQSEGSENQFQIIMENVQVVSIKMTGGTLDAVRPTETLGNRLTEEVAFAFENAEFIYGLGPITSPGGNPEEPVPSPEVGAASPFSLVDAKDSDGDGLTDRFEKAYGLDLNGDDGDQDSDGDGLSNREELAGGSEPNNRRSRFGVDSIKMMRDKPGRGLVSFRGLPGRHYRLLGSPTGQQWFELTAFTVAADSEPTQQEIELPFNGLTQLLRVEVTIAK